MISEKTSGTIVFLANFYLRINSQIANPSLMQHLHSRLESGVVAGALRMQPVRLRGGKMRQRIWASGDVNAVWPKLTNAESTGGKRQKDTVSRKLLRQQMKYAFQMKSSDWKQMALEYTQNSSLHGLRYMGSTDLHFTER